MMRYEARDDRAISWTHAFALSAQIGLLVGLGALALAAGCATTVSPDAPRPLTPANDPGPPPTPVRDLDYRPIEAGFSEKLQFERDEPRVLVDLDPSRYRAFVLPASPRPLKIKLTSYTSFEVPHYPVKYIFCPRIVLLDPDFAVAHRSSYADVRTSQKIFQEPRLELEYVLGRGSAARYLLIVREPAFDGHFVESMYESDSGLYDELGRKEREKVYSSRTGPVRLSLEPVED